MKADVEIEKAATFARPAFWSKQIKRHGVLAMTLARCTISTAIEKHKAASCCAVGRWHGCALLRPP